MIMGIDETFRCFMLCSKATNCLVSRAAMPMSIHLAINLISLRCVPAHLLIPEKTVLVGIAQANKAAKLQVPSSQGTPCSWA